MDNKTDNDYSLKNILIDVVDWILFLKSKWKLFIISILFGGVLGIAYSVLNKPLYTANLTFALEEKQSGGAAGLSSIASTFGLNLAGNEGGAFTGDNIIQLMKSRLIIEKTLLSKVNYNGKEILIINEFIKYNEYYKNWSKNPELANLKFDSDNRENFSRVQDSVLWKIQSRIAKDFLEVSKIDKKLSIISVKVKSENELFSKLFCENLVKNVTHFYIETKVGKSKKNINLLELRVDSVKRELDNAMLGRAVFADQNIGLIRQSASVPKLKQEMRIQLLGTMYNELVKNLEFSKLALLREEPLIQIIDTPILPLYVEKLGKAKGAILGMFLSCLILTSILTLKRTINKYYKN